MTYTELTQAQYDRLDELKSEVVQNIMQWVPRQLKMVIYDEELEYFGRGDAYIHPAQFQAGRLQQTFLLPAEIMAYEVTEADAAKKLALLEDMVEYFDAEMVTVQEKKVISRRRGTSRWPSRSC